jgi:SAM-dependent methyltransferase
MRSRWLILSTEKLLDRINGSVENSSRIYLEEWLKTVADVIEPHCLVLDAGSGEGMYRHLFGRVSYESADFCKVAKLYVKPTYVCDLAKIPVEDERYDVVICTQVLEHVPEPIEVLKEFYRILKPGGKLFLSAPLFFEEHEQPYDFYRYTQFGLANLLTTVGFRVSSIEWLEGYYGTLSYQMNIAARSLSMREEMYGHGIRGHLLLLFLQGLRIQFALLAAFFSRLDVSYKHASKGMCKNYRCVSVKPV